MFKNKGNCQFFLALLLISVFSLPVYAQDGMTQVKEKLENYNKLFVKEKLFTHTDKDLYLAGEIVYFKIYNVDGCLHRPMNVSKVAYVEITDANHKSIMQAKIGMNQDGGSGSLYLPLTLNTGNYILRTYTNWMNNFGPEAFFEKRITIINTIKSGPISEQAGVANLSVAFFPEGGQMITGIPTRIGFKVTDSTGRSMNAHILISSTTGDTITQVSTNKFGIGSFSFTPNEDKEYVAQVTTESGQRFSQPLPKSLPYGYVLNVSDNGSGKLKVHLKARHNPNEVLSGNIFLIAHSRQVVKSAQQGYLGGNTEFVWYINKSDLGEGINHITLFNELNQPVCERLVFGEPVNSAPIQVESDNGGYSNRKAVNLSFSGIQVDSLNCSVSVFKADSSFEKNSSGIANYFWLESELGPVESAGYYLSGQPSVQKDLDDLLLTQGWRRFKWSKVLGNSKPEVKFIPEVNGHVVKARVTEISTGRAATRIDCYLSVPSYPFGFYLGESDNNGIVRFNVNNYYGPGEMIAQVATADRNKYRVDILSPYTEFPSALNAGNFNAGHSEDWLLERSIAMQAQNIYRADSNRRYAMPKVIDTMAFFGKPEFTYMLDEYKRFTTMEEVLREYVMPINVRASGGKLEMAIFDESVRQFYTDNILVLLDGIPIYDYNRIFSYDPLKIRRLQVIPRRYLYGPRVFSGIASFESTNEKFDGFSLDPSLVTVDYEGLQLQREFYSPSYATEAERLKRIPDMRTTLFWEPFLKLYGTGKSELKFYTSDLKGRFVVVVNGISKDGRTVFGTHEFVVE